jgi:hypothetical protein
VEAGASAGSGRPRALAQARAIIAAPSSCRTPAALPAFSTSFQGPSVMETIAAAAAEAAPFRHAPFRGWPFRRLSTGGADLPRGLMVSNFHRISDR